VSNPQVLDWWIVLLGAGFIFMAVVVVASIAHDLLALCVNDFISWWKLNGRRLW
jgi:hypothetical protein